MEVFFDAKITGETATGISSTEIGYLNANAVSWLTRRGENNFHINLLPDCKKDISLSHFGVNGIIKEITATLSPKQLESIRGAKATR